jgi:hypothetical protein
VVRRQDRAQAGLTLAQIDDPKVRLEARAQVKLLEIAAEELKDDWLGYHLAREYEPAATGLLHYVLASAENLADALSKAERYTRIVHEGIALTYTIANAVVIALEDVGVERVLDRQQIEFMLFGLVRACRIFTDTRLAPLRLTIRHVHDGAPPDLHRFWAATSRLALMPIPSSCRAARQHCPSPRPIRT